MTDTTWDSGSSQAVSTDHLAVEIATWTVRTALNRFVAGQNCCSDAEPCVEERAATTRIGRWSRSSVVDTNHGDAGDDERSKANQTGNLK